MNQVQYGPQKRHPVGCRLVHEQSRLSSVPATRRLPPGPAHVPSDLLCARSHLSSTPVKHPLPPNPGCNFPAPGQHDAKSPAGPAAAAAAEAKVTGATMAAAATMMVAAVMVAAVAAVAVAAMTTTAEAMTTAVIAARTTPPGPRGSQTFPETAAVSAAVVAVAENTHPAQQAVAPRAASSGAPKLRRGCATDNHEGAGPCSSPVRGYCRCSSRSIVEPWVRMSLFSTRGGNLVLGMGAAAPTALFRKTSGTAKAYPACPSPSPSC